MRFFARMIPWRRSLDSGSPVPLFGLLASLLLPAWTCHGTVLADDLVSGAEVYRAKCASCHGEKGEGKIDSYPNPLVGDRSLRELTEYIAKTMPEDKPGTLTADEARQVSQFIHETFYSVTAQARNKPARVDLARLTVGQYRNVIADLFGSFRPAMVHFDPRHGLNATYYSSRNMNPNEIAFQRYDATIDFDFQDKSPEPDEVDAYEFAIRWEGAILAPDTGEYEFLLRSNQSSQLWVNNEKQPLVDAYVKSGNDDERRGSIYLIGGRLYPFKVEISKFKRGVNDKQARERPPAPAFISASWKRPNRPMEIVPNANLSPNWPTELCITTTPFPPDDRSLGWEKATSISKEWDQATTDAAIELSEYAIAHLDELSQSNRNAVDRVAKLKAFCSRFAERAFRRPLDDERRSIYVDRPFERTADPEVAVNRSVLLVLKSPRFLYRELGGTEPAKLNDPFDVASRISFGLWDSMPDQVLLDAAAKGELSTKEQVAAQARRMVGDLRTTTKLKSVLMKWLKVDRVIDLAKDPERYPDFDEAIANDLRTSLELSLDDFLASPACDLRQLLTSDATYLNGRLAKFYGVDLPANAPFQKVSFEPNERAGVLTHPYLMSSFAYTGTSSPIHRGVFVARSVLGRTLRPPPEAVTPIPPKLQPDLTTRDRVSLQTKPEACQACHALVNPLGFPFERFDAVGKLRKEENGKPLDTLGNYRTRQGDNRQFNGAKELAQFLVESEETHAAFVEQLFQAVIRQPIRAYGSRTKDLLRETFVRENFNLRNLLVEIIAISALTTDKETGQTTVSQ